jgi:hypothetical protein
MRRFLVLFKYLDHLVIPDEKDNRNEVVINQVISKLREGVVALENYDEIHDLEIDNENDNQTPVIENATIFEIRLLMDDEIVDFHDGGEDVYYYVLEDLELNKPEITYIYTAGDLPLMKTVIGIDINYPVVPNDNLLPNDLL